MKQRFGFLIGMMSVALAMQGCGGSAASGTDPQYRTSSTTPPVQASNIVAGVQDNGTTYFFSDDFGPDSTVVSVTAYPNGSPVALSMPPAGLQMPLIFPRGIGGSYNWTLFEQSGSLAGTVVWNLATPNASPVVIQGFEVAAVREDGREAVGWDIKSGQNEYCDAQGHTSPLALPNGLTSFVPSCINMKNQVGGLGFSSIPPMDKRGGYAAGGSNYWADYVTDGVGSAMLLEGSIGGAKPTDPQFVVSGINDSGEAIGGVLSDLPRNEAVYWDSNGKMTVLKPLVPGQIPTPEFIASDGEIFGSSGQAIVWASSSAAPVAVSGRTQGQMATVFTDVCAVSPNGRNLVVAENNGLYVTLQRSN